LSNAAEPYLAFGAFGKIVNEKFGSEIKEVKSEVQKQFNNSPTAPYLSLGVLGKAVE